MKRIWLIVSIVLACMTSCREKRPHQEMSDAELKQHAIALAKQYLIVDGHVDLPYRVMEQKRRVPEEYPGLFIHSMEGDFDFDRAMKGGLDAPFMSVYVPSAYQTAQDMGKSYADSLINLVQAMPMLFPTKFALANAPQEVSRNTEAGLISLPMGMENGAPIGHDLKNVEYFFNRGIRYITLTHSKYNQICGSSGDTVNTHQGLTEFGRKVVLEMNRVGMMVDISHVDDTTFYQVMKMTAIPCIASHSSCRHFVPAAKRDMTDDMILKMGANGGVILINFYTPFIDSTMNRQQEKLDRSLTEKGLKPDDSLAQALKRQLRKDYPVDMEEVTDHIDHVAKLIGIDHVGFGSDFDGVDAFLPAGLEDVSCFPNLIYGLLKRGYTEDDIQKICGGNFLRVWQTVQSSRSKVQSSK